MSWYGPNTGDCGCSGTPPCDPIGWINVCSIGYYVSDVCDGPFLFRILKDGIVIEGPLVAKSFSLIPDDGEIADYVIEYCIGESEPCEWIEIVSGEVDTTGEDECPMGIYGQTYVVGIRPSDNEIICMSQFLYCQSSLVVRASALCFTLGQKITHLWIDDTLWTPNTTGAGALAADEGDPVDYSFVCHNGRDYGHIDTPCNEIELPQIRIPLPISFTKESFSVRARQTNGMIIGCTVPFTCTAHYNTAATTLPNWSGMALDCEADGGAPINWGVDPSPVRTWCEHFSTSLDIVSDLGGTFSWITCQSYLTPSLVVGTASFVYNFKCNGQIKWIDPADSIPRPVYSGTYSFDHTVTLNVEFILSAAYAPGSLAIGGIDARISGDITSTITGHNDWPTALQAAAGAIDWLTVLNDTFSTNNRFNNPDWFTIDLWNNLGCGPPSYDSDTFQWKWIGPQFPFEFWKVFSNDWQSGAFPIVDSPVSNSGGSSAVYTSATWPAGTQFQCELEEGSYFDETESAVATQFQT